MKFLFNENVKNGDGPAHDNSDKRYQTARPFYAWERKQIVSDEPTRVLGGSVSSVLSLCSFPFYNF